jgi:hypothetical protein
MRSNQYEVVDITEMKPYRERRSAPPIELDYRLVLHKDEFMRLLKEIGRGGPVKVRAFSGKTPKESEEQEAFESQLLFRGYHAHFLDLPDVRGYEKDLLFRRYVLPGDANLTEVNDLLSDDLINEKARKFLK